MTTGRTPGERNELQAHLPTAKHASYEEAGSDSEIAALTAHLGDVLRTLTDDEPAEAATRGENLTS